MSRDGKRRMVRCGAMVIGAAIGDAMGVPYEFRERGSFKCTGMRGNGTHSQPAGTWSDDTSMMLATMDSLRRNAWRVSPSDLRRRFERWYWECAYTVDRKIFDIGTCTATAIVTGRGQGGERDQGNGSLMRILPLAFTRASDEDIRQASAVTHSHPVCQKACVQLVHVARALEAGANPWMAVAANAPSFTELMDAPMDEVGSSGYVLSTMGAALWCLCNTTSYRECVLTAVNMGDDSDTVACIAGGLAAITYGGASIPPEWIRALRGKRQLLRVLMM